MLGDSLAFGTGAGHPSQAIGPRLAEGLERDAGPPVSVTVCAVPGATSSMLAAQAGRALRSGVDVAVVITGANDLTRLVPPVEAAQGLARCVWTLREGGAQVVVATVPDLSAVPSLPPEFRQLVRDACHALEAMQVHATESAGGIVAPLGRRLVEVFARDASLFSSDRYHPSSKGYALVADALLPYVTTAARRQRRSAA